MHSAMWVNVLSLVLLFFDGKDCLINYVTVKPCLLHAYCPCLTSARVGEQGTVAVSIKCLFQHRTYWLMFFLLNARHFYTISDISTCGTWVRLPFLSKPNWNWSRWLAELSDKFKIFHHGLMTSNIMLNTAVVLGSVPRRSSAWVGICGCSTLMGDVILQWGPGECSARVGTQGSSAWVWTWVWMLGLLILGLFS